MARANKEILTFWLIPAEPARSHFARLIHELAARFDAPVFDPHVTIYGTSPENEDGADLLNRALGSSKPYRLSISGIEYSEIFTKTLFVQFERDSGLAALNSRFRAASISHSEHDLNPHLSLIYKTMADETKAELARTIALPFSEVVFDSAKAVISAAEITSRHEVELWRVVAEQKITG